MPSTRGTFTEEVDATGKVAIVTGANTGLGLETVRGLNKRGAKVYMLCRSEQRCNDAIEKLSVDCDHSRLIFQQCDMSKFSTIRECAKRIEQLEDRVDILVNNAGIMFYPQFELTEDGHEMTWQSNYLGPFLLTELLLPLLKKSTEGRIVIVSSYLHHRSGPLDLMTVDSKSLFGKVTPYYRSKLANVMHGQELAKQLIDSGVSDVTVNSLHPGLVSTDLARDTFLSKPPMNKIKMLFMKNEAQGAKVSLFLALSPKVNGVTGKYFDACKQTSVNRAATDEACRNLREYSLNAVGLSQ